MVRAQRCLPDRLKGLYSSAGQWGYCLCEEHCIEEGWEGALGRLGMAAEVAAGEGGLEPWQNRG